MKLRLHAVRQVFNEAIFHLALLLVVSCCYARKLFAFQELQGSSATCGDMSHLVTKSKCVNCCCGIAAADDSGCICLSKGLLQLRWYLLQGSGSQIRPSVRSIQRSLQILQHQRTALQSSVPISSPIMSAGIALLSTTSTAISASIGFGNAAAMVVSTGRSSFFPSFSAFSSISLQ